MPLPEIMDAVVAAVGTVPAPANSTGIKYVSYGVKQTVAESVAAWVVPTSLVVTDEGGPDREWNSWVITIRLIQKWQAADSHAEKVLIQLVEGVRQVFRAHIKLGLPTTVARALVHGVIWGYDEIDGDIYRWADLRVDVMEKVAVSYGA